MRLQLTDLVMHISAQNMETAFKVFFFWFFFFGQLQPGSEERANVHCRKK